MHTEKEKKEQVARRNQDMLEIHRKKTTVLCIKVLDRHLTQPGHFTH